MNRDSLVYTVVCCTSLCEWWERCASYHLARVAAHHHEREHDGHVTFVFPPEMSQETARS